MLAVLVSAGIVGLMLGSFASALSWRIPRGQDFVKARSACPSCGHTLSVRDLVPVFSWLSTGGKCRYCKAPVSKRYPLIELATLVLCLSAAVRFGADPYTVFLMLLAPVLVAIIDIDLHYKIIPDGLNLAVAGLGLTHLAYVFAFEQTGTDVFVQAGIGMVAYGAGSALLRAVFALILKKESLGLGDVKFFAASGLWLGTAVEAAPLYLMIAGASGVILALIWRRLTGEEAFPFGPCLVIGFWGALVFKGFLPFF